MSTDLVRRCDVCREDVPPGRAVALIAVRIQAARAVSGGSPVEPLDVCSPSCATRLMAQLYREATEAGGDVPDPANDDPAGRTPAAR